MAKVNWGLLGRILGIKSSDHFRGMSLDEIKDELITINREWEHKEQQGFTEDEIIDATLSLYNQSSKKLYVLNLLDKNRRIRTGYEESVYATNKNEAIATYLQYILNHEDDSVTIDDIVCAEF